MTLTFNETKQVPVKREIETPYCSKNAWSKEFYRIGEGGELTKVLMLGGYTAIVVNSKPSDSELKEALNSGKINHNVFLEAMEDARKEMEEQMLSTVNA